MSDGVGEFHYRLPQRFGGQRPGAHAGSSLGGGQQFAAHRRLMDHADPRRIDLRASLRDVRGDWLVRIARQRVAVPVQVIVDVSASMQFGARRSKAEVAADFVECLGHSAFRAGDPLGLLAFDDAGEQEALFTPARHSRGVGPLMAQRLREHAAGVPVAVSRKRHAPADTLQGLRACAERLAARPGLVFLVSDFHGMPAPGLAEVLDRMAPALVLPMLAWDPAEAEPPEVDGLLALSDAETGVRRSLWLREPLRRDWRAAVARRRAELAAVFDAHALPPCALIGEDGGFDPEALTRHFMEQVA
jgi:hypothetical protein